MQKTITEGKARIKISEGKISRKLPVFYNPGMKLNRDISVLLLKSVKNTGMRIADPLAASGIRGIRMLLEMNKSKIRKVFINDASAAAADNIKKNLQLNKLSKNKKIKVANEDASVFLLKNRPFDYVDIDPFGTPVSFLDAAIKSLRNGGILAVTATDTAALAGSAPEACLRKYWAFPLRNYLMHEFGLRILIRRIQLAATASERALTPVYSYSLLHYMRVFLRVSGKKRDISKVLKQHSCVSFCSNCFSADVVADISKKNVCSACKNDKVSVAGPVWTGRLFDPKIAAAVYKNNSDDKNSSFLKTVAAESKIDCIGFYDTHVISKKLKMHPPKLETIIAELRKKHKASRTHFSGSGIRTDAKAAEMIGLLRLLKN